MAPFIRTVTTKSGSRAVQIVYSRRGTKRDLVHVGSAKSDAEYELLLQTARQRMAAGQQEFDLGETAPPELVVPITHTRMGVLWDILTRAYDQLQFSEVTDPEDRGVFRNLVLARIIEPSSKLESIRVLAEAGISSMSYATLKRRLPAYATSEFREGLSAACVDHAGIGPSSLVLYDVTTLYFETDGADELRVPGFSKERRLEPQITLGLLTDTQGFPLAAHMFEGNKAETHTMLPVIKSFIQAHGLTDITVVADAGMVSEANKNALDEAGLSYILGARVSQVPAVIQQWRDDHPGEKIPDKQVFSQARFVGVAGERKQQMFHYRYRADYARRTIKGVEEQLVKARKLVAGEASVKKNRYVKLTDATKSVNEELAARKRDLAGIKGYVTNLTELQAGEVVAAYHRLWQVEKSFRMSNHDLQARPIFHRTEESIRARLSVVLAALAVSRWVEAGSGWSIRRVVKTFRRYKRIELSVNGQLVVAADPVEGDDAAVVATLMRE